MASEVQKFYGGKCTALRARVVRLAGRHSSSFVSVECIGDRRLWYSIHISSHKNEWTCSKLRRAPRPKLSCSLAANCKYTCPYLISLHRDRCAHANARFPFCLARDEKKAVDPAVFKKAAAAGMLAGACGDWCADGHLRSPWPRDEPDLSSREPSHLFYPCRYQSSFDRPTEFVGPGPKDWDPFHALILNDEMSRCASAGTRAAACPSALACLTLQRSTPDDERYGNTTAP